MFDNDSGPKFGEGLLLGAAIGLAVGLLYAPRRGEETRAMLKEKAEELAGIQRGLFMKIAAA